MVKNLKKIITLFIIPNLLFNSLALANNKPTKKKSVIIIKKTENQSQVEKFDFRKAKWGMNHQDIQSSEKIDAIIQEKERLVYPDSLLGINASINYYFENSKLIKASYLFDGTFTDQVEYIVDFIKIKKVLKEKYGSPTSDNSSELDIMEKDMFKQVGELISSGVQEYETKWETPKTQIKLILKGKDIFTKTKLELGYTSRQLKHLDDDREVEKNKF